MAHLELLTSLLDSKSARALGGLQMHFTVPDTAESN